jgi:isoquinoline 1-oxidoreductase alpha subunit
MPTELRVNGKLYVCELEADEPLLWALRESCQIKSPKFGCGAARCGACTVHVDGKAIRSCVIQAGDCQGKSILTVEGLAEEGELHPLQQAWIEEQVPQCGYCQCGQIMGALALLQKIPDPTVEQIDRAMAGHLCRCGTYPRIQKAIQRAAVLMRGRE